MELTWSAEESMGSAFPPPWAAFRHPPVPSRGGERTRGDSTKRSKRFPIPKGKYLSIYLGGCTRSENVALLAMMGAPSHALHIVPLLDPRKRSSELLDAPKP